MGRKGRRPIYNPDIGGVEEGQHHNAHHQLDGLGPNINAGRASDPLVAPPASAFSIGNGEGDIGDLDLERNEGQHTSEILDPKLHRNRTHHSSRRNNKKKKQKQRSKWPVLCLAALVCIIVVAIIVSVVVVVVTKKNNKNANAAAATTTTTDNNDNSSLSPSSTTATTTTTEGNDVTSSTTTNDEGNGSTTGQQQQQANTENNDSNNNDDGSSSLLMPPPPPPPAPHHDILGKKCSREYFHQHGRNDCKEMCSPGKCCWEETTSTGVAGATAGVDVDNVVTVTQPSSCTEQHRSVCHGYKPCMKVCTLLKQTR